MRALPLFLVSAAAVGLETALTRFFALANWSDYGYWVISIVMVGFAFAGVTLALAEGFCLRHAAKLLAWLPALLTLSAALGYTGVILNPFNPLALQNPATWMPQLGNIGLYYAALLPFFFLTGLFISLCFSAASTRLGKVYAADMVGAAAGTMLVLGLMFVVPAFALAAWLLPLLALAALFTPQYRTQAVLAALVALGLGEALLAFGPQAQISQYKPIYPPLHTPGARVLATLHSPRGEYMLLDDFTERVNTDISNDSAMLGYAGPPRAFGLYRDGIRIASLPRPGAMANGYAPGALDALPYTLRPHASALLIGASGGFKPAETLALGATQVVALEPEPVLYRAITEGLGVPHRSRRTRACEFFVTIRAASCAVRRATMSSTSRQIFSMPHPPMSSPSRPRPSRMISARSRRAACCPCRCPSRISRPMRCACSPPCAKPTACAAWMMPGRI